MSVFSKVYIKQFFIQKLMSLRTERFKAGVSRSRSSEESLCDEHSVLSIKLERPMTLSTYGFCHGAPQPRAHVGDFFH